ESALAARISPRIVMTVMHRRCLRDRFGCISSRLHLRCNRSRSSDIAGVEHQTRCRTKGAQMNKYLRTGVVLAASAALSAPLAATAETETIKPGRDKSLPAHADITKFRATNGQKRVVGTVRLAKLN